jgi:hypothetical protein
MATILSKYKQIEYEKLPGKMQESYNFQKASAILADYGFVTNLLKYDWMGADFLAQHKDGDWLKIQLKGRLTTDPKYEGKDIYVMFEDKKSGDWYLYPHDKLTEYCRQKYPNKKFTTAGHSRGTLTKWVAKWLAEFKVPLL